LNDSESAELNAFLNKCDCVSDKGEGCNFEKSHNHNPVAAGDDYKAPVPEKQNYSVW